MAAKRKKTNINSNRKVRDRLLDSAEELFCEYGFDGASIRDIAASADCNIASVNYYFGGKEKLYQEVWRRHLMIMLDDLLISRFPVERRTDHNADSALIPGKFCQFYRVLC